MLLLFYIIREREGEEGDSTNVRRALPTNFTDDLEVELAEASPLTRDRAVAPSDLGLTVRQGDVLALVLRGLPNKRIAAILNLSESTVKEHMNGILGKLGVSNRVHTITFLHLRRLTVVSRQQHVQLEQPSNAANR